MLLQLSHTFSNGSVQFADGRRSTPATTTKKTRHPVCVQYTARSLSADTTSLNLWGNNTCAHTLVQTWFLCNSKKCTKSCVLSVCVCCVRT